MPTPVQANAALVTSQLALLKQLEWKVRHAVENVLNGEYRSAFRGRGMEFDQVVKYTFGDDIRDIDWNVTARLGEPYRKKFVEEREVSLLLVFEDSVSLQFGSGAQSKREALLELAGLLMMLGAVNRDRVGFLYASPAGYTLKEPVRGRGQILHAAAQLLGQPPPALQSSISHLPSPSADFMPWRLLAKAAPRHSIMIWLGDFPPRIAPEGWSVLSRRYQTMGFRVDDPWERELPHDRTLTTYDPVAGRLVTLNSASSSQRAAHAAWVQERDAAFKAIFADPLSRLVVRTDEDRLDALVRFFHARMFAGHHR
ncbi:DUF58 domain-containing protein [Oleiharenicola lentus]|uniref:DUF58 domain-containing protein n=1 Tax=Oleiharenicola lentus TaxID=2508720 RepID=UPI003F67710E